MSKPERERRSKRRRPDLDTVYTINADGSRNFLHPADVSGRWQTRKNLIFALLIAVYALLPWIEMNGKPLIHLDIPGRAAHLFGATFSNQDFYLVFFLVTGLGFGLIVLTSLLGRVWCGYACPQTVFMEGVFRRIERWIEGPRHVRIRRNLAPASFDKTWRKGLKHLIFVALSFVIAHIFLAYFIPARELIEAFGSSPAAHKSAFFWTMFWTGILYFDYAWFREQTCLIICPYGRLQSALVDQDTVIIGYDEQRGEPRSKAAETGGDCIDCYRCVEVCPTGIDIRNGLQMECIGCANCIDACDEIMDRLDRPRGLVRYDSTRSFEQGARRFLRGRVWVYLVLGLLGLAVFSVAAGTRAPFQATLLRTAGMPFLFEGDMIRNNYTLLVQNKSGAAASYFITPGADADENPLLELIIPQRRLNLDGLEDAQMPVLARMPRENYEAPFEFTLTVSDSLKEYSRVIELRFRGP